MCERAIRSGRHVLVEKPMAENAVRAKELFDSAAQANVVLTVYHNRRFDGDFMALRRLLQSGRLGRVLEFESRYEVFRTVDPVAWREQAGTGGILTNLGPHLVDQAIVLFGAPRWVYARTMRVRNGSRIPDYFRLELGYPDTAVVLGASYQALERMPRFVVRGTDGSWTKWGFDGQEAVLKASAGVGDVSAGGREYSVLSRTSGAAGVHDRSGAGPERVESDVAAGDYGFYYRKLYEAIRDGASPPVIPEEALLTASILDAAAESAATGRRVELHRRARAMTPRPNSD
jgi:predicted dehydrogenase